MRCFEKYTKSQHQLVLAFGGGTIEYQTKDNYLPMNKNDQPQVTEEKMNRIWMMFADEPTQYSRLVATEIGIHHVTLLSFLRRKQKLFPSKLQMNQ